MTLKETMEEASGKDIDEVGSWTRKFKKRSNNQQVDKTMRIWKNKGCINHQVEEDDLCIRKLNDKAREKRAQGGLSVAGGCRCLTKELDMIAC